MLVALVNAGVIPAEALAACTGTPAVTCTGATSSYERHDGLNVTVAQGRDRFRAAVVRRDRDVATAAVSR